MTLPRHATTAVLALLGAGAIATAPAALAGKGDVLFPAKCDRKLQEEPEKVIVGCEERDIVARKLKWKDWGDDVARGRGNASVNDCDPTCPKGKVKSYDARVELSKAGNCGGDRQYKRLDLKYTGDKRPDGPRKLDVRFRCAK